MADVAFTLQNGRREFNYRRMLVCRGCDDAVTSLKKIEPGRVSNGCTEPVDGDIAFIFSGQGSQYVNMALGLYQQSRSFGKTLIIVPKY